MNLGKINEVIKASPAIQIQSKISLLQRRAWNVLLANAYNELPDKDIHSVSLVELSGETQTRHWESRLPERACYGRFAFVRWSGICSIKTTNKFGA